MATRVQTAYGYNTSTSTSVPTQQALTSTPTAGNVLILRATASAVYATPSGYTLATRATDFMDAAIFYKVATGSEPTNPSFTLNAGAPGVWQLEEWSGVGVLDQVANANTASASQGAPVSCGTTSVTTHANTVAFAVLASFAPPSSITSSGVNGWQDSFSADAERSTTFATDNVYCSMASRFVSSTVAVTAEATYGANSQHFSGALAVFADTSVVNQAPTANAGLDQTDVEPFATVTLNGSGTDPNGTVVGYAWRQISGPSVTLSSVSVQSPTFTAPGAQAAATCLFGLTVTDNDGGTSPEDTVSIAILPATEFRAASGSWVAMGLERSGGVWQ